MFDVEKHSKKCIDNAKKNSNIRRPMLREFARALHEVVDPKSVIDVGCGPAFFLEYWAERGKRILGLEYSAKQAKKIAADSVSEFIIESDVSKWDKFEYPKFDLAVSFQVAEHIPKQFADNVVRGMTNMSDDILFSAAEPGQQGVGHVNCQPMSYWTAKFIKAGYMEVPEVVDEWRKSIRKPYNEGRHGNSIRKNIMHYARKASG
jgi:cyclopropane fatty-acyl-phospholipid synthase-like methyltransferase